jgi:four helix bundle protein
MEYWGIDMEQRKNKNRGYQQLRVWQDAKELYQLTWQLMKPFPYELKRLVTNQIASVDSVHRNIAEGYCRKSVKEYLQFLNIALASLGESVSAMNIYENAEHISSEDFEKWDALAYKLENGLMRLVVSLQNKRDAGDWNTSFQEPEMEYGMEEE